MKRTVYLGLGILLSTLGLANQAKAEDRAISIDIYSVQMGQPAEWNQVQAIITKHLGSLDKYLVVSRGTDGGGTYCIEFSPFLPATYFDQTLDQLKAIEFDPAKTTLLIHPSENCKSLNILEDLVQKSWDFRL